MKLTDQRDGRRFNAFAIKIIPLGFGKPIELINPTEIFSIV